MVLSLAYEEAAAGMPSNPRRSGVHLKVVELCYKYALLQGRERMGLRLSDPQRVEFASLRQALQGDPERQRRAHRRFPVRLEAAVKLEQGFCNGQVVNLSASGMYLTCTRGARRGSTVQVKLGQPGEVEYLFTCNVIRCVEIEETWHLGLSFSCVPLEIRK